MSTLTLRLAGPLQSWGASSRFEHRTTELAPTKSAVIGLLAAASGLRRCDPIEHLTALRFGARLDQPGVVIRDYHTRYDTEADKTQITPRLYLADAAFLVAIEGHDTLIDGLVDAILHPVFPLFLGRRSCPPAGPLHPVVHDTALEDVLATHPWVASHQIAAARHDRTVTLPVLLDAAPDDNDTTTLMDTPVTFNVAHRKYALRKVARRTVTVPNPTYQPPTTIEHDPFAALGV